MKEVDCRKMRGWDKDVKGRRPSGGIKGAAERDEE
jgi:hypothetical protein